jgi:death-on-curing protein
VTDRHPDDEPRWISESVLLAIHARQIERYGGMHGVRDRNVVFSALAKPRHRWTYDNTADLPALAAAYLAGFARSQGFNDGNKRTALAVALVFLAMNGAPLHAPPAALYALTMAVATGKADDATVAAFIREQ